MKTLLIPLDDRPVTYTFPALVAKVAGVEAILPPRQMMGALTRPAQMEELLNFAEGVIARQAPEAVIVSLDSILYGGLITGRRSKEDAKTIMDRLDRVKKWKGLAAQPPLILAQSSIMRISDNYDNSEEKEYWSRFGREIYQWSGCLHRLALGEKLAAGLLESLERRIPADIRQDYLDTRRRNFSVNLALLKSMGENAGTKNSTGGIFDHLIFSQDDSGAYGLNVSEKERLTAMSKQLGVDERVSVYAGADEVLMTLLARLLVSEANKKMRVKAPEVMVYFSPPACSSVASRYEGQDLGTTVASHVAAAGLKMTVEGLAGEDKSGEDRSGEDKSSQAKFIETGAKHSDTANGEGSNKIARGFTLIIHGPEEVQGDHITLPGLADLSDLDTSKAVCHTLAVIERAPNDVIIADVAYANGGDPKLVEALLSRPALLEKIKSYGGWNTAGNTMGAVLALAVAYWYSQITRHEQAPAMAGSASIQGQTATGNTSATASFASGGASAAQAVTAGVGLCEAHKQCLFVRLIDDWAYQACVRKQLKGDPSTQMLALLIGPHIAQVNTALQMEPNVRMCFPWKRTFEIEISFEGN